MRKGFDKHVCYWFVVVLTGTAAIIGGRLGLSLYSDSFIAAPKVDNPNTNPSSPDDRGKRHAFSPLTQDSSLPEHIFLQLLIKPRDVFGFNGEISLSYSPDITCYRVSGAWNGSEHFRRAHITTVKISHIWQPSPSKVTYQAKYLVDLVSKSTFGANQQICQITSHLQKKKVIKSVVVRFNHLQMGFVTYTFLTIFLGRELTRYVSLISQE